MLKRCRPFPSLIRSWVDLPLVCTASHYLEYHFQDCQNCFCRPLAAFTPFGSLIFLIPGTFHPRRWSLSSPCCPTSEYFPLNSNPLNLAPTRKPDVRLPQNVLS